MEPRAATSIEGRGGAHRERKRRRESRLSDISLWEIAVLAAKGRFDPGTSCLEYMNVLISALMLRVLPVTPEIAWTAQSGGFGHGDPADRIIGATALVQRAALITRDAQLRANPRLLTVW